MPIFTTPAPTLNQRRASSRSPGATGCWCLPSPVGAHRRDDRRRPLAGATRNDDSFFAVAIYDRFTNARQLVQQIGRALRTTDKTRWQPCSSRADHRLRPHTIHKAMALEAAV